MLHLGRRAHPSTLWSATHGSARQDLRHRGRARGDEEEKNNMLKRPRSERLTMDELLTRSRVCVDRAPPRHQAGRGLGPGSVRSSYS